MEDSSDGEEGYFFSTPSPPSTILNHVLRSTFLYSPVKDTLERIDSMACSTARSWSSCERSSDVLSVRARRPGVSNPSLVSKFFHKSYSSKGSYGLVAKLNMNSAITPHLSRQQPSTLMQGCPMQQPHLLLCYQQQAWPWHEH